MRPWVIGLVLVTGCGRTGDVAMASEGSSEGDDDGSSGASGTNSASGPSDDGAVDDSGSSGSADDEASDSDAGSETGAPAVGPDIRLVYVRDDARPTLLTLDVVDGELSAPTQALELPHAPRLGSPRAPWITVGTEGSDTVTALDASAALPIPPHVLKAPDAATHTEVVATTAEGMWLVGARGRDGGDLWTTTLGGGGFAAPWQVDDASMSSDAAAFVLRQRRVAFAGIDATSGEHGIWLGSVDDAGEPVQQVARSSAAIVDGIQPVAGGDALVWLEGSGPSAADRAWYLDLAAAPIGVPEAVETLPSLSSIWGVRVAPIGHGFVAVHKTLDGTSQLAWTSIKRGKPESPVVISTAAAADRANTPAVWSPDARWLAFVVENPATYVLARMEDGPVGTAVVLDTVGPAAHPPVFDPEGRYVYLRVSAHERITVKRISLDRDGPGEAETVSPDVASLSQGELSDDGSTYCYIAAISPGNAPGGWCVDVSGEVVDTPVRFDRDVRVDETLHSLALPSDASHVLYGVRIAGTDDDAIHLRHTLADRTTRETSPLEGTTTIDFTRFAKLP